MYLSDLYSCYVLQRERKREREREGERMREGEGERDLMGHCKTGINA